MPASYALRLYVAAASSRRVAERSHQHEEARTMRIVCTETLRLLQDCAWRRWPLRGSRSVQFVGVQALACLAPVPIIRQAEA